jgi:hypothetical protein
MKKVLSYILILILGFAIGSGTLLLFFRNTDKQTVDTALGVQIPTTVISSSTATTDTMIDIAMEAASYIKAGDWASLGSMVHPTYGVYFSPSATVNLKNNQCFTADQITSFGSDSNTYVWGTDTNGQPIELTPSDYFKQYVYNSDYLNAQVVSVNYTARTGNSLENVSDTFPNAQYVDLCFPGTAESEYRDWSILRLVFEEYEGAFRLTAVIHSEYTN